MNATPDQVWQVLGNGWLYPLWVVGVSRMRGVDNHWPEVGTNLHRSVGTGRIGTAGVTIRLHAADAGTEVSIEEDAVAGPALLVPRLARTPMLKWRNAETLRRLAFVVEGRQGS